MTRQRVRGGGSVPARRAIVRWAWRLFRREWRQQVLVVGLMGLTVALAVSGVTAAYNMATSGQGSFGSASERLGFDVSGVSNPEVISKYLAGAEEHFGTVDAIGERSTRIPGSVESLALRWQDPAGPYSAPMLRLLEGRYPSGGDEVALTDEVAQTFDAGIGDSVDGEGTTWQVVGLVENPADLDDEFVLAGPWRGEQLDTFTILFRADDDGRGFPSGEPGPGIGESRPQGNEAAAASGALAASTLVMALVCLVAASGFVVLAQRRLRQLGMLAAVGATQRQVRLVVVANGAAVGAVAALAGTAIGIATWVAVRPRMETVAGHRIDGLGLPVVQIVLAMLLAVIAAGAAAWWPARTLARVPITRALSGRPPRPRRARRSLILALALVAAGTAAVAKGVDVTNETFNDAYLIAGALAIPLGIVLAAPVAVRSLAPLATRLPVAARLALRDLARYQARAGAALAAISLGLGVAVAIVLIAAAATHQPDEGNLSDRQLLFRTGEANEVGSMLTVPPLTADELAEREAAVDRIAGALDHASVVGLDVAVEPEQGGSAGGARYPVVVGRPVDEDTVRDAGPLYLATPAVLDHLGVDPASIAPETDVVTPQAGPVVLLSDVARDVEVRELSRYSGAPRSLLMPDAARARGWETVRAAWFVEAAQPLTDEQIADAREAAATADISVESRRGQEGLIWLRTGATVVGVLLALSILSLTVGLVRGEAVNELRTLTATGAGSRVRRTITAVTAGALALLGAALGTVGAYAGLAAGYSDELDSLRPIPVVNLLVVAVGCPLLAAAAGWLLAARREPAAVARTPIE